MDQSTPKGLKNLGITCLYKFHIHIKGIKEPRLNLNTFKNYPFWVIFLPCASGRSVPANARFLSLEYIKLSQQTGNFCLQTPVSFTPRILEILCFKVQIWLKWLNLDLYFIRPLSKSFITSLNAVKCLMYFQISINSLMGLLDTLVILKFPKYPFSHFLP